MSFLVVKNNRLELEELAGIIRGACPDVSIKGAYSAEEVLALPSQSFDVAFIDPELEPGKMSGVELAEHLKKYHRNTHVIFVSKNKNYYEAAFSVHADGYFLLQDISAEKIKHEMDYLMNNYPSALKTRGKVFARTFGGFDLYLDGEIVTFDRSKAKELLALLVDRRGGSLTPREACAFLFEGYPYDTLRNGYYHVVVSSLTSTLDRLNIGHIIKKNRKRIAIVPNNIECDAYNYLRGDVTAIRQYDGNYLSGYRWAGYATKLLNKLRSEPQCRVLKMPVKSVPPSN